MQMRVNPYEPTTSEYDVVKKSRDNDVRMSDPYSMSYKIATAIGVISGFLIWLAVDYLITLRPIASWLVQGACLALALLPASFYLPRQHAGKQFRRAFAIRQTVEIASIWGLAATTHACSGEAAARMVWVGAMIVVWIAEVIFAKRNK